MDLSDSWATRRPSTVRLGAAEAVLADLRQAIEAGELAVGTRLPSEATLAARYAVSRSVVREALRSTTAIGLTETHTGKGTFVIANSLHTNPMFGEYSAHSLREARPHIEIPAAGFAALRRTEDQLSELRTLATAMDAESDPAAWVRLDGTFHLLIAEASGNKVFVAVIAGIRSALAEQSAMLNLMPNRTRASNVEHRAVLEAIESGSYKEASGAMGDHLRRVELALASMFPDSE